jgi:hypothetical protein
MRHMPARMVTVLGVAIGGLRVPQPALAQHLALRGAAPLMKGGGPLIIAGLAESGPIDVLRGVSVLPRQPQLMEIAATRNFAPVASQRLDPGMSGVAFDSK